MNEIKIRSLTKPTPDVVQLLREGIKMVSVLSLFVPLCKFSLITFLLSVDTRWKLSFNLLFLLLEGHILCAFLISCKYGSKPLIKFDVYFTGFT